MKYVSGGQIGYSEYHKGIYKTYTKSREYPVELKFVDGTEKMICGFEKVIIVRTDEGYQSHTGLEWRQSTEEEIKECGF